MVMRLIERVQRYPKIIIESSLFIILKVDGKFVTIDPMFCCWFVSSSHREKFLNPISSQSWIFTLPPHHQNHPLLNGLPTNTYHHLYQNLDYLPHQNDHERWFISHKFNVNYIIKLRMKKRPSSIYLYPSTTKLSSTTTFSHSKEKNEVD
jgi:hypothetical protein